MGAFKLCGHLSYKINKMIQRMKTLFKPEQTYEEWLRATNLYRQMALTDSVEIIHNYLNEKKENDTFAYYNIKLSEDSLSQDISASETLPLDSRIDSNDKEIQAIIPAAIKVREVGKIVEWAV